MLSQSRRLSRPDFLLVKSHGTTFRYPDFNLVIYPNPLHLVRVSVVTSTKFHKRAVVRNRFRRLVYLVLSAQSGSFDLILFPRPTMLKLSHEEISARLSQALSSLSLSS